MDEQQQTRDLAEWDAEIEADFQRAQAATKAKGRRKRGQRWAGAPIAFLAEVCRLTKGRSPLAVALLVYRRTVVCRSRTVTLPSAELVELGVGHRMKSWALGQLVAAGLIRVESPALGHSVTVTLLWGKGQTLHG